jgi:hypothetical protein
LGWGCGDDETDPTGPVNEKPGFERFMLPAVANVSMHS